LTMVHERHGNRYEVDDAFLAPLHEVGVDFVGFSADGNYPEVFEIPAHPFYIGTIYHPEFLSRPNKAHPLFAAFIGAAAAHQA
jgi:CTP synthase